MPNALLRLTFLLSFLTYANIYAQSQVRGTERTLILVHPTVSNIQRFQVLLEEGVFPLPTDYRILGLAHQQESYDYQQSVAYLQQHPGSYPMEIKLLDCTLDTSSIYNLPHPCSGVFEEFFSLANGIIFLGGHDLLPIVYQTPQDLLCQPEDPYRSIWESSFIFHLLGNNRYPQHTAWMARKPEFVILGICLGMQTLNAATGGTLYQDIPARIYGLETLESVRALPPDQMHRNYHRDQHMDTRLSYYHPHRIRFTGDNRISAMAGNATQHPVVMSSHHQAIQLLSSGWEILATSMDGQVIEAIGHQRYPHVLGVQYHPELREIYQSGSLIYLKGDEPGFSFARQYEDYQGYAFHLGFWREMARWLEGIR